MNRIRFRPFPFFRSIKTWLGQLSVSNLFYISMLKRKRQTLKLILLFMIINILISITILRQQTKMTIIFKTYCRTVKFEPDLLSVLKSYRLSASQQVTETSPKPKLLTTSESFDYVFNRNTLNEINLRNSNARSLNNNNKSRFYEPTFLINNEHACKSRSSRDGKIFMIFLIHSHKNNYLRRKAMRDTWLSLKHMYLAEILAESNLESIPNEKLELSHLFVVGSDEQSSTKKAHNSTTIDFIRTEANTYNDILMIDTVDNYRNLLYKHLAVVNWANKNCQNTTYVVKLDDDVYVNLKPLIKHLYFKFGLEFPINYKFIYCNVQEMAKPIRHNDSKWFVDPDSYPFESYPVRIVYHFKFKLFFFIIYWFSTELLRRVCLHHKHSHNQPDARAE